MRGDEGTVTAFVVIITTAVLMAAGLVVDGGAVLAGRREAVHAAEQAARAGAQALDTDVLRRRDVAFDTRRAHAAAQAHLRRAGVEGSVSFDGARVRVHTRVRQGLSLLRLVGLDVMTVTATGEARPVRGLTRGET